MTFVEVVDELAVFPDEDVQIDGEELIVYKTLQSIGYQRLINQAVFCEHRLEKQGVSCESIVTDTHGIS